MRIVLCLSAVIMLVCGQLCENPKLYCFDSSCGLDIEGMVIDSCVCEVEDYSVEYSACDPVTNTRKLVYFWKPPATCRGGVSLPPPIEGIPCDQECKAGQRLDVSGPPYSCVECSAGEYSAGGGVLFEKPWTVIPAQFTTECIANGHICEPWRVQGSYVDSGDNFGKHNLQSLLTLQFELVVPGNLTFEYKFNAEENFDKFVFAVEGLSYLRVQQNTEWTSYTLALPVGHHLARWFYNKDYDTNLGEDKAFIRKVEVTGLNYGEIECLPCPPGTFSEQGWEDCSDCPANTWSSGAGMACTPCDDDETSFPGSSLCTKKTACGESDYSITLGPCTAGEQSVTYGWISPPGCDVSKGTLPPPTTQSCDSSCRAGQHPSDSSEECIFCPAGTASEYGLECTACEMGTASVDAIRYYNTWSTDEPNAGWSTSCEGDCGTPGWRFGGTYLDSGAMHGLNHDSRLTLTVDVNRPATITFDAVAACPPGFGSLQLYADDQPLGEVPCEGCGAVEQEHEIVIPASKFLDRSVVHSLTWSYEKAFAVGTATCDKVRISNIVIENIKLATGATSCKSCPMGSKPSSSTGECEKCPAGMYHNDETGGECKACEDGTFSLREGSSSCVRCGANTVSNADHTGCVTNNCGINVTAGETYSLASLAGMIGVLGPLQLASNTSQAFYISLCTPFPVNHTCYDLLENEAWSDAHGRHTNLVDQNFMPSFACLVDNGERAASLGSVIGFQHSEGEGGFVLTLSHGSLAADGVTYRRSMAIDFICDATAGKGSPEIDWDPTSPSTGAEWRSVYACPLCLENDYSSFMEECTEDGKMREVFFWKNPKTCHDGIALPEPIESECDFKRVSKSSVVMRRGIVIILIGVSLIVVTVAASVIYILWKKHSELYQEYARLQTNFQDMDEDFADVIPVVASGALGEEGELDARGEV